MKESRIIPLIFGLLIIYIGVVILLNSLGFHIDGGSIFPLVLILLGYYFYRKKKKVIAYIFFILGLLNFLNIDIGDIIGFIFAFAFIYFGYRLIRKKQEENSYENKKTTSAPFIHEVNKHATNFSDQKVTEQNDNEQISNDHNNGNNENTFSQNINDSYNNYRFLTPQKKHSLIGNCFLTDSRWELKDMDIWYGLGEVKIDLSRANISEQKSTLLINGWIGDVDIYVPYDLDVTIIARVSIGEIEIFGNKEGGINQTTTVETANYRTAVKRVEIVINLFIGDIDVNYL